MGGGEAKEGALLRVPGQPISPGNIFLRSLRNLLGRVFASSSNIGCRYRGRVTTGGCGLVRAPYHVAAVRAAVPIVGNMSPSSINLNHNSYNVSSRKSPSLLYSCIQAVISINICMCNAIIALIGHV